MFTVSPTFGTTTAALEPLSLGGGGIGGGISPSSVELGEVVDSLDDDIEPRPCPRPPSLSMLSRPFDFCLEGAFESSKTPASAGSDSGLITEVEPEVFDDAETSSGMPRACWSNRIVTTSGGTRTSHLMSCARCGM